MSFDEIFIFDLTAEVYFIFLCIEDTLLTETLELARGKPTYVGTVEGLDSATDKGGSRGGCPPRLFLSTGPSSFL